MFKELREEFMGVGEVKNHRFCLDHRNDHAYIYVVELMSPDLIEVLSRHYEVFERRVNSLYGCVRYPRSKAFGVWAFTYRECERDLALKKFYELTDRVIKKSN